MKMDFSHFDEFDDHASVLNLGEPGSPLKGFIAIHRAYPVPAVGGTRVFPYASEEDAVRDVLRLSNSMTNKCAIAGLSFGGAKGVIIANPSSADMPEILKLYAQKVGELGGRFYTGQDVGLSEDQVQYMLRFSPYFIGKKGMAGDPSVYAAYSAFVCLKQVILFRNGSDSLVGLRVSIKGTGKTGGELARLVAGAGGSLVIADIDEERAQTVAEQFNAQIARPDEIHRVPADVYAPCALGRDLTPQVASEVAAGIICGTANNQLSDPLVGEMIFELGIIHVPDYLANAGGLIDVGDELLPGGYSRKRVMRSIQKLPMLLADVLERSRAESRSTDSLVTEITHERLMRFSAAAPLRV